MRKLLVVLLVSVSALFIVLPAEASNGDANGDQVVSVSDIVYLINYMFGGGPEPISSYKQPDTLIWRFNDTIQVAEVIEEDSLYFKVWLYDHAYYNHNGLFGGKTHKFLAMINGEVIDSFVLPDVMHSVALGEILNNPIFGEIDELKHQKGSGLQVYWDLLEPADSIDLRYSTSPNITELWDSLPSVKIPTRGAMHDTYLFRELTQPGTYYFMAKDKREGLWSDFSNVAVRVIAVPDSGPSPSIR